MNIDENLVSQKRPIYQHEMRQPEREHCGEYISGIFLIKAKNDQVAIGEGAKK